MFVAIVYKDALLEYFVTGEFNVVYPFLADIRYPKNLKAIDAHDFVGVNYYQHYHIAFTPFMRFSGVPFDMVNKTQGYNFTDMVRYRFLLIVFLELEHLSRRILSRSQVGTQIVPQQAHLHY